MRSLILFLCACQAWAQTAQAEFQRGLALGEQRNFQGAVQSFSRAIQLDPRYERAYYYRAQAQAFLGNYDAAFADYNRALQFKPGHFAYLAGRTEVNRDRGMLGLAIREADKAIADHYKSEQRNPLLFALRGTIFWRMGLVREAEHEFDMARKMAYELRNSLNNSIQSVERYVSDYKTRAPAGARPRPAPARNPYEQALAASEKGDERLAVTYFDTALEANPNHAEANFFRGRAFFRLYQYGRAIDDLKQAVRLNPNLTGAWRYLGLSYFGIWQDDESLAAYSEAIKRNPKFVDAYLNRAQTYLAMKPPRRREAVADFGSVIALDPANAKALNGRAVALQALGNSQGAIADLQQAIQVQPKAARAYCNMGVIMGELGRKAEEQQWYNRCWAIDGNERAWYEGQKKWADAYEAYHRELAQMLASVGSSSSSSGSSSCSGYFGGGAHACEAGDRQAADRFQNNTANQSDKNKYSGGW
ncbi:MAG: tetratricopeptide repeat protein [Bryobacteraceae bacterium]